MFCNINKNDNYTTNKEGWEKIKKFIPDNKIIYSPFYSDGNMKQYFSDMGYDIIHNNEDFFESYTNYDYDIIIDNIPFSRRREIFKKLKEIGKPFIIICLSTIICSKWFYSLFKNDLQIIIPENRTTFFNIDTPNKKYTPPLGTFYFCYKMNLEKDLNFI